MIRFIHCFFLIFLLSTITQLQAKKPNFIVILTDDQGYQDLGCFGSPNIRTPNLDQMAAEGMKLTSFYAQTVCGPSRASLMTGSYPMRNSREDDGTIPHPALSLSEVTIPEVLKSQGYVTGMAGKWDLQGRKPIPNMSETALSPCNQGFDECLWMKAAEAKIIWKGDEILIPKCDRTTLTKMLTDQAISFVEEHKDQPFFFYLAHPMPHTPLAASAQFLGKSKAGLYGDVVEELDFHTGRLLDKVKDLGLDDNTYIIYYSDNGPWWIKKDHAGHAEPLRSAKTSTYDGGVRVPFIIRAPSKVPAGTNSDLVCASIDLLPTIAKLAGAKTPKDRVIDGLDVSEVFHGKQKALDRPFFFYQHQALRAVRQGDWKLHLVHSDLDRTKEGKTWQKHVPEKDRPYIEEITLYNLKDDISETTNVAKQNPKVVKKLLKQIEYAKKDIGYHDVIGKNSRR